MSRRTLVVLYALMAMAVLLATLLAAQWAQREAQAELMSRGADSLRLAVANLRGGLLRYESLPRVLSRDKALIDYLKAGAPAINGEAISRRLGRVNDVVGSLDTYLMDRDGLTVAASNWRSEKSFLGKNYAFRPYFQGAMNGQSARYFALGSVSNQRGYYFAHPISNKSGALGALVVKASVEHFEQNWGTAQHEIIVTDEFGITFLSSEPSWLFRALEPLTTEQRKIVRDERRYGNHSIEPLPIEKHESTGQHMILTVAGKPASNESIEYLAQQEFMPEAGWTVSLLQNSASTTGAIRATAATIGLGLLASCLLIAIGLERWRRNQQNSLRDQQFRAHLEDRVDARTSELNDANHRLRQTRAELVQAERLAALGQLSAGLSHELAQPITAIHSYVDNTRGFLARGQQQDALVKLDSIDDVTERLHGVLRSLKTFARNDAFETEPIDTMVAIERAVELISNRTDGVDVVVREEGNGRYEVNAAHIPLQQILLNLLTNALDAVTSVKEPRIQIVVSNAHREPDGQKMVEIAVIDNGSSLSPEQQLKVFDAFYTTKPAGHGLGLGLAMAQRAVERFGGTIAVSSAPPSGTVFVVSLPAAKQNLSEYKQ